MTASTSPSRRTLHAVKRIVPVPVKSTLKRLPGFFRKPELRYLELHLTDHCNLNCKGCSHYCPLAPPRFADLRKHQADMRRLRELFGNIGQIRLMGGEPLLHRDVASFITATRAAFPKSDLRLVTNGILLPRASAAFWDACRDTNTTIDLSEYPTLHQHAEGARALCKAEHVSLRVESYETFHAHLNLKGDSDEQRAFQLCRSRYYCPFLKEGHLYVCAMQALVEYFNRHFGYQIPAVDGIDIHSRRTSGRRILRQLNVPVETCKWCSYDFVPSSWSVSKRQLAEWDAAER